jgi:hypothetical protein
MFGQDTTKYVMKYFTIFFSDYKINDSVNMKLVMKWSSFSYNVYTDIMLHVSNQYL